MGSLLSDLRYAIRLLGKTPGFAAVALITLALAIGANTAVFSVVNAVLLRPLPYPGAQDIVALFEKRTQENAQRVPISAPDFVDWRRQAKSFSSMAVYDPTHFSITGGGDPERVPGTRVSAGFFEALGVQPYLGKTFGIAEEQPGHGSVAIVSYGMWQRRLGGDRGVLGKTIVVNGAPYRIAGVLPQGFRFPFAPDSEVFAQVQLGEQDLQFRGVHQFSGIGRVKPGTTTQQAQAEMDLISRQLERQYPDYNTGHAANLIPLRTELSWQLEPALRVLLGAVILVALIACANIANLLLARAASRRREMAVRMALGSSRSRLVRQSLTESALLASGGAGLGILSAMWSLEVLRSAFFNRIEVFTTSGLDTVAIDWRVLAFTLTCAVLSTMLFGISPAFAQAGVDLNEALRSGRGSSGATRSRLRSVLIVAEVALSLTLLTGAGLLGKSFVRLLHVNLGFQAEHLLTAGISLPSTTYRSSQQAAAFYDALLDRTRGLPRVRSAAVTDTLPLAGDDNRAGIEIPGRVARPGERLRLHPRLVSTDYLQTMGVPLLAGRAFSASDAAGAKPVAILSETAVRQFWPEGNAVGRHFKFSADDAPLIEVIGVVAAVHTEAPGKDSTAEAYMPFRENPFRYPALAVTLVVRTGQDEGALAPEVRAVVASLDRSLPISGIRPMAAYVTDSVAPNRFNLVLLGIFAAVAIVLAAAGVYGVMAYLVNQRTGEIGLRMALGARPADVLGLVMRKGMGLALGGVLIGFAAALAATRLMSHLLFGVEPRDPAVFGAASVVLLLAGALATYIPARRASRVDPLVALRNE